MKRKLLQLTMLSIAIAAMVIYGCSKDDNNNSAPSIQNITTTPNTSNSNRLPAGEQVNVTVTATDADKDNLSYSWAADGGNFVGETNSASVSWESPISTTTKEYEITATVSDGAETRSDGKTIYVDKVTPGINALPKNFDFGTNETEFQVKIFNTGEGVLIWETYSEGASWLTVNPSSGTVNTPNDTSYVSLSVNRNGLSPNNYTAEFRFRNDDDVNNYVTINIEMEVAETADLGGFAYYASTTIPVSGVLVTVGENTSTTGTDGSYEINDVLTGTQILTATKDGYDTYSSNIQVGSGTNEYNIEITSAAYTHNLFGEIINQVGDPLSGVLAVVLNPDGTESSLKTTSSASGYYQIPTVPQGERTLRFIKETCESFEINIFMANSNYELDIELQEYGIACPEEPTVNYEGQIYNTVLIGDQCWLKENLNVGTMIPGDDEMEDNEVIEKYCYDDNPSNCNTYGALYQWNEMMQYNTMQGTRGICPPNWHIPTDQEWKILEGHVDSQYPIGDPEWDGTGSRGYDAGQRLKTQNGWNNNGNGTDLFGFSALPGGYRGNYGGFDNLGEGGEFWSSTDYGSGGAWFRSLYDDYSEVGRGSSDKTYGRSVRCVRD